jgi:hypothetical protein
VGVEARKTQVQQHSVYEEQHLLLCVLRRNLRLRDTTSQLVRTAFQSIHVMGSHEGAFSAKPAAGDHPRGGSGK